MSAIDVVPRGRPHGESSGGGDRAVAQARAGHARRRATWLLVARPPTFIVRPPGRPVLGGVRGIPHRSRPTASEGGYLQPFNSPRPAPLVRLDELGRDVFPRALTGGPESWWSHRSTTLIGVVCGVERSG